MTEPIKSISGCERYDDIQSRLQQAKTALTTAVTDVEQAAARAALTLIETEASAHATNLNDRMRVAFLKRQMSHLL
jgi:hypothetical protein